MIYDPEFMKQYNQDYARIGINDNEYIVWLQTRLETANEKIRQYEAYILDLSKKNDELEKTISDAREESQQMAWDRDLADGE